MQKQRNSNIELLRIFSMFLIVAYHLISNGLLKVDGSADYSLWNEGTLWNRISASIFFPGGAVGNMLFFMITGYFLIGKQKASCKKVVSETIFYSVLLALLYLVFKYLCKINIYNYGGGITLFRFLLIPIASSQNWFSTAYILIILLLPYINDFEKKFSQKGFVLFLLYVNIFWVGFGYFLSVPFYDLLIGFFYYSCGAFYRIFLLNKRKSKGLDAACVVVTWTFASFVSFLFFKFNLIDRRFAMLLYAVLRNLIAPICSFFIFHLFLSFELRSDFVNKIAGTTFAVYLIHGSVFQRFIWDNLVRVNTVMYRSNYFPLRSMCTVFLVFAVCSVLDFGRQRLYIKFMRLSLSFDKKMRKMILLEKRG